MNRLIFPLGLSVAAVATAQDFESSPPEDVPTAPLQAPVVTTPSGFPQGSGLTLPPGGELLRGFSFGLTTSAIYDSNVNPGPGGSPDEGDMIFSIGPNVRYRADGGLWSLGASAAANYSTYFDNSDLGGLGYNFGVDAGYHGSRLSVDGSLGTSLNSGNNRYYGAYSESLNHTASFSASYRLSAKTSLDARFRYRQTDPDQAGAASGARFGGSENIDFDLSAMWQATPLLRIGPGVAWSWNSGDNQLDRETVGPLIRLQYQLARKVSLDGTFSADFVDYAGAAGGGGDDTTFSTRIGVNYRASSLWGMNLSVYRGTTADGAAAGTFRENTSIQLGYNRRIRRASLVLGAGYETNDAVNSTGTVAGGGAGDFFTFNASLGMPILRQRVMASTFFDWREPTGGGSGRGSQDDGYRVGVSLSSGF